MRCVLVGLVSSVAWMGSVAAQTSSGPLSSESETQAEIIDRYEEVKPGERGDDRITGQFWFKLSVPETRIRKEKREVSEWRTVWVYDPETCSNVLKRKKYTYLKDVDVEETFFKTERRCVTLVLSAAELERLAACDCDDISDAGQQTEPEAADQPLLQGPAQESGEPAREEAASGDTSSGQAGQRNQFAAFKRNADQGNDGQPVSPATDPMPATDDGPSGAPSPSPRALGQAAGRVVFNPIFLRPLQD